ncbi:type II secretion system F family protein [Saccharopolyspora spinosporotrichia]|nr:type II secretion system F family protein [Saccharopolyspora erythraea]EQD87300.1 hypothetical protein N599_05170 [Saccharopolyspora erythraea D]
MDLPPGLPMDVPPGFVTDSAPTRSSAGLHAHPSAREQVGSLPARLRAVRIAMARFAASMGGCRWADRFRRRSAKTDPLVLAAGWDLLAAGMRAGLPVPVILRAVAAEFDGAPAGVLDEVARLLALGADAVAAWEPALRHPDTEELARAARRTARTGTGLADVAADLAADARASVGARAQAHAQRATVWVALPLGLCFLPAFLCLGVLPVVAGMLNRIVATW